jgi:hypothetical protein
MSSLVAAPPAPTRVPVAILDPRERGRREGMIDRVQRRSRRIDLSLTLDDGAGAGACLTPEDFAWMELRVGDIVGVDVLATLPCFGPEAVLGA